MSTTKTVNTEYFEEILKQRDLKRLHNMINNNIIQAQRLDYVLNFTITFNPNRFTRIDSLASAPKYAVSCIMAALTKICDKHELCAPKIWYIDELMKNGYGHLHGQILMDEQLQENQTLRAKTYDNVSGILCKKIGNNVLKWNQSTTESEEYPTYYHYMRKDPYHQDNVYYYDKYYHLPKPPLI